MNQTHTSYIEMDLRMMNQDDAVAYLEREIGDIDGVQLVDVDVAP